MSQQVCAAMLDMEEPEDEEPEMVEHRANFSRTVYSTELASITFEAPEGADGDELDRLAWEALDAQYVDWCSSGDYDVGDTALDEIEGL